MSKQNNAKKRLKAKLDSLLKGTEEDKKTKALVEKMIKGVKALELKAKKVA